MADVETSSSFPEGFMWGTVASSTQTEGAAPASDWSRWERDGRAPVSGDGNGFATRFAEDFAHLAELGLTHHRLSLEWARLEPSQGHHDGEAVEHYREILRAGRDAGLAVWVSLHHVTSPGWFAEDLGGFVDDRARSLHWARHVDFVAEHFGDLVHGWVPIHEPVALAVNGHLRGTLPPGRHSDTGFVDRGFIDVLRALHLANADAARLLHGNGQPVMTAMNLTPVVARSTTNDPAAIDTARTQADFVDQVIWGWTRMLREGVLDIPQIADIEVPSAVGSFDVIGFSHQHAGSVDEFGTMVPYPNEGVVGPLGEVPSADGLAECIERVADELPGRPIVVSGFGVATTRQATRAGDSTQDDRRGEVVQRALEIVEEEISGGIDVRGFFHRTAIDGYEFLHGHDVCFGLLDADRNHRASADLAASWARR